MRFGALVLLALVTAALFGGCSEKQFKDTSNDIADDISNFGKKVTEQH